MREYLSGRDDIFHGIGQVGTVKKIILFETSGLLNFKEVAIRDFEESNFSLDHVHCDYEGGCDSEENYEGKQNGDVHVHAEAELGAFL